MESWVAFARRVHALQEEDEHAPQPHSAKDELGRYIKETAKEVAKNETPLPPYQLGEEIRDLLSTGLGKGGYGEESSKKRLERWKAKEGDFVFHRDHYGDGKLCRAGVVVAVRPVILPGLELFYGVGLSLFRVWCIENQWLHRRRHRADVAGVTSERHQ